MTVNQSCLSISVWTTESARGPLYGGEKPSHWLKQLDVANKVQVIKGEWRKRCRIKGGVQWFRQKVKQIKQRFRNVCFRVRCRKPTSPLSLSACCLSGLLLGRGLQLYGLWEGTLNTSSPFHTMIGMRAMNPFFQYIVQIQRCHMRKVFLDIWHDIQTTEQCDCWTSLSKHC